MNEYERRRDIHQYWYNKSSDLRASAGVLWYCSNNNINGIVKELGLGEGFSISIATQPVFPMLCGLSLELLYKAICIAKGTKFNNIHDLIKLSELAGVTIKKEKEFLLKIYTESIIWDGKYPVPIESRKEDLFKLGEVIKDNLFDAVESGNGFRVYRPNGSLNWDNFNSLWIDACDMYFNAHNPFG